MAQETVIHFRSPDDVCSHSFSGERTVVPNGFGVARPSGILERIYQVSFEELVEAYLINENIDVVYESDLSADSIHESDELYLNITGFSPSTLELQFKEFSNSRERYNEIHYKGLVAGTRWGIDTNRV